jgi:hypothetical protein
MELTSKDLIAVLIIVCSTILVVLDKIPLEVALSIISLIIGYYFGYVQKVMGSDGEQEQ